MALPDFDTEVLNFLRVAYKPTHYDRILAGAGAGLAEAQSRAEWRGRTELATAIGKGAFKTAATTGAGMAIGGAMPVTNVATGVVINVFGNTVGSTVNPITWAFKPWLAAKEVADIGWSLEKVYAVMDEFGEAYSHKYNLAEHYLCTCAIRQQQAFVVRTADNRVQYSIASREATHKDCQTVADFLKEQKDAKAAKIAINSTVVGVPFYMVYAAARSIYKRATGTIHQDRSQAAQHLIRSAMPTIRVRQDDVQIVEHGCRKAQALMALLLGELNLETPHNNPTNYPKTLAALIHPDGWYALSSAFSAAVITDTPAFLQKRGL